MVAAVETNKNSAAFYSLRQPAWHKLGYVSDKEHTPHEMLELAHLSDWNVRAIPIADLVPSTVDCSLSNKLIIRNNPWYDSNDPESKPTNALGIVGDRYTIAQNEELAELGAIIEGRSETAGSLNNGATVFMSFAMEREIHVDPNGVDDIVKTYLLLYTSHNGTSNLVGAITPVRVVCANTLAVAKGNMRPVIKLRHSRSLEDNLVQARQTMALEAKYTEQFADVAGDLFEVNVTDNEFDRIIRMAFEQPDKDSKAAQTRWSNKIDDLWGLWNGPTQAGIKNTGWGVLNALTEYGQWHRAVYKGNEENFYAAGAGFDGVANDVRNNMFELVTGVLL